MEKTTIGFLEGFRISSKVCDLLEDRGVESSLADLVGTEVVMLVLHELGIEPELPTEGETLACLKALVTEDFGEILR